MDNDGGTAVESGLKDLAVAMANEAPNKKTVRQDKSSDSEKDKRSTTSGETRISSALSEIAELVSRNTIEKEEGFDPSIFSSGASNLASQVTDGAIGKVRTMGLRACTWLSLEYMGNEISQSGTSQRLESDKQ